MTTCACITATPRRHREISAAREGGSSTAQHEVHHFLIDAGYDPAHRLQQGRQSGPTTETGKRTLLNQYLKIHFKTQKKASGSRSPLSWRRV
jgi:hypothetical protein